MKELTLKPNGWVAVLMVGYFLSSHRRELCTFVLAGLLYLKT